MAFSQRVEGRLSDGRALRADPTGADITAPPVRPRLAVGVIVVLGVLALQIATDLVAQRGAHVITRIIFLSLELPIVMATLTASFRWSVHRGATAGQGLVAIVALASLVGAGVGVLYALVAARFPELRPHFWTAANGTSFTRFALFGALNAQLYFGIWALAFVYPFAVESLGVRALEAQHLKTQAELARLRSHLEPHFLLNTLNAIAGLVTEDPREARRLLVCLGDLLRDAVQHTSETQPLDEQIAWLRRYAQILEARHHGVLRFRWQVDPECSSAVLPRLLLQPLVENAVKHGALRRDDGAGEVTVTVSPRPGGGLVCVVEDNGPGMPTDDVRTGAFGLRAVRRRLELEAPRASLRLESSATGTRSVVELAAPVQGAQA